MYYTAVDLPAGLTLEPRTGRISGVLKTKGRYLVRLTVQNRLGSAERSLTIMVGDEIALTPPLGWNSFNCWGSEVSQAKVLAAARGLVASGLRDHGWNHVNIDDGWQGIRGGPLNAIQPNSKFPDMQKLADEIHRMGLKFGIYSTPWKTSYGWHIGSSADYPDGTYDWIKAQSYNRFFQYQFPPQRSVRFAWLKPFTNWLQKRSRRTYTKKARTFGRYSFVSRDVRQWMEWKIDYLKYDWVPVDISHLKNMHDELAGQQRDIVYSVANNAPFSLAPELAKCANSWRTSVDLSDTWQNMSKIGFSRDRWAPFNMPGHYNDADMLVIGGRQRGGFRMTRLTSDEQYTHMSLWCLLAGPLLLGCDLQHLDPFTLGLVTNDEVLEINQDPLCKQATRVASSGKLEVYAKLLEDGSVAAGLFNRGDAVATVRVKWSDLQITGRQTVRDLWRQKDLGIFSGSFESSVASHGVVLVRFSHAP